MRIALRTSGGRGEYEVAGSQKAITVSDVVGRHLVMELIPAQRMNTNNLVQHAQGKPRIRLQDPHTDRHLYRLISAALLLPRPIREIGITPGGKLQVADQKFSISSIQFDIIDRTETRLVIQPTRLVLENSAGPANSVWIDVVERLAILQSVWVRAAAVPQLAPLLEAHKKAVFESDPGNLEVAASALRALPPDGSDPLRYCVSRIDPGDTQLAWMALHSSQIEEAIEETNPLAMREAALERIKVWRRLAIRGPAGAKFGRDVREAYRDTCLITGHRLPYVESLGAPGVDSAHILPWAEYDLNLVTNGICLSKHCHWAFDAGVLRLDYDESIKKYLVSIGPAAKKAHDDALIDLSPFISLVGEIPQPRLPIDIASWPNPSFLELFNASMSA